MTRLTSFVLLRIEQDIQARIDTNSAETKRRLFSQHEALDPRCAPSAAVALDQRGAHASVVAGRFKSARHSGEKPGEHQLFFDANDAVVGAAHADVGLVGGASGEDALIRGRDMGVGAEERGDASVGRCQPIATFFPRSLRRESPRG